MNRSVRANLALTLALVGAAGCKDWLTGPGLTQNPNSPVGATAAQQLIAVQASGWVRLEGQLARNATFYTQQFIGTNNQQLTYGTQYTFTEADVSGFMSGLYTGAGLVGMRNIQSMSNAAGDATLEGISKI